MSKLDQHVNGEVLSWVCICIRQPEILPGCRAEDWTSEDQSHQLANDAIRRWTAVN